MKKLFLVAALLFPALAEAQIPTGTVSGQLLNRDGKPAASVRVSAMAVPDADTPVNSATALVSIAMTDNEGRYRLENVLPGRYYILAGFVDLPTYYPGVAATSGATVVNVLSGTPVSGINFSVANTVGVSVSGRVRRATGTGAVGGQRVAMIGGTSGIQEVTTAADGSFQFLRVRPGTYQIGSMGGRSNQPFSVMVEDKDVTGIEIVVVPTVDVTGNIELEGNGPRPRLQLQFAPFKGNGQSLGASSTPDGSFRVPLPEGDYRVSWSNLPLGYEIKSLAAGNVDLLTTPLKLSVDAPLPAIRLVLSVEGNPFVKVSGRVINVGSTRTLSLSGPNLDALQLTINPDGTFEIPQALPGNYRIGPNLGAGNPSLAMQTIQVVIPNQDTNNLVITLPLTKEVQGIVVNSNGVGVPGRFSLSYSQRSGTSSSSGSRGMTTQGDGKFTLDIPVGGDVQLSISIPGASIKSSTYGTIDLTRQSITVAATDTAEIRVVLDSAATTIPGSPVGAVGGFGGGGGTVTSSVSAAPVLSPTSSTVAVNRITEAVAKPNLLSSAPPAYPPLASAAKVQGTVVLQVEVSIEGRVQNVSVVSGHALLNEAALQAVRQWTYKPFVLNGQPIPVVTTATVPFTLP